MFNYINKIDDCFKKKFRISLTTVLALVTIVFFMLGNFIDFILFDIIFYVVSTVALIFSISTLMRKGDK